MERDDFVELIPHAGRMCLVDRVEYWDDLTLRARCWSHREAGHPLAREGRLSALHALEYGAQAMAVHGGLLARRADTEPASGLLAGARNLRFDVARLDWLDEDLEVEVARQFVQAGSLIYDFLVSAGDRRVAGGTVTVVSG